MRCPLSAAARAWNGTRRELASPPRRLPRHDPPQRRPPQRRTRRPPRWVPDPPSPVPRKMQPENNNRCAPHNTRSPPNPRPSIAGTLTVRGGTDPRGQGTTHPRGDQHPQPAGQPTAPARAMRRHPPHHGKKRSRPPHRTQVPTSQGVVAVHNPEGGRVPRRRGVPHRRGVEESRHRLRGVPHVREHRTDGHASVSLFLLSHGQLD